MKYWVEYFKTHKIYQLQKWRICIENRYLTARLPKCFIMREKSQSNFLTNIANSRRLWFIFTGFPLACYAKFFHWINLFWNSPNLFSLGTIKFLLNFLLLYSLAHFLTNSYNLVLSAAIVFPWYYRCCYVGEWHHRCCYVGGNGSTFTHSFPPPPTSRRPTLFDTT